MRRFEGLYEPSRLQLSDKTPQSERLSLPDPSNGEVAMTTPLFMLEDPLSTLSHIEAEQPWSQTGHMSSGPTGKQTACTDQGLQMPEAKCPFLKLFTRFSAFSRFFESSL